MKKDHSNPFEKIKTATVLGVNGTMGAASAAIIASFGAAKVYMLARDEEKAKKGVQAAIRSVRSQAIADRMEAGSYDSLLDEAVSRSDWVFECVAESYDIKEAINQRIAKARRPGTLVSTVSSGLSIARLAQCFDEDGAKHYYGTHFFNPPYKLTLCELVTHAGNDPEYTRGLSSYLRQVLRRYVVLTNDTPAFAGNRVGFQLMNEAAIYAEKNADRGGIHLLDTLLGTYTGRAMSPLATADLVGLDVHKAIVDNIYEKAQDKPELKKTFLLPTFMQKSIDAGRLGSKTKGGLYKSVIDKETQKKKRQVYNITQDSYEDLPSLATFDLSFIEDANDAIRTADYFKLAQVIQVAKGEAADIVRHFIARYISYSLSLVPEVSDMKGIDGAMGFGFNWLPPSAWTDLLGGAKSTMRFIESVLSSDPDPVPNVLRDLASGAKAKVYSLRGDLDYRSLLKAH